MHLCRSLIISELLTFIICAGKSKEMEHLSRSQGLCYMMGFLLVSEPALEVHLMPYLPNR